MIEKGLEEEKPQIEGHPRKTLRKAMQKKNGKKNGKEGECLSISRGEKEFSIEKR